MKKKILIPLVNKIKNEKKFKDNKLKLIKKLKSSSKNSNETVCKV